jgi:hypothetical protein
MTAGPPVDRLAEAVGVEGLWTSRRQAWAPGFVVCSTERRACAWSQPSQVMPYFLDAAA